MACTRDCVIKLSEHIKSFGISVNIGKNKARGNKGFFKTDGNSYKIDIRKNLSEEEMLRILVHEFVHYVHYTYDKTLKSLDFIFPDCFDDYYEDLLKLTVDTVPKKFAEELFNQKYSLKNEIDSLSKKIKTTYPNIKLSDKNNHLNKEISRLDFKYLLKYDRVKILSGFSTKVLSIEDFQSDFPQINPVYYDYLILCSLKRQMNRVNSKISRLNRYYNSLSELLARSFEYYVTEAETMRELTPKLYDYYKYIIYTKKIKEISEMIKIVMENGLKVEYK